VAVGTKDSHNPHNKQRAFSPPRLRGYRHVRDLNHHHIATSVGTTPQTIEQIETGTLTPDPAMIRALATTLGCAIDDLTTTGDPLDNDQYWDAACAALPPLSDGAVQSVAATLDRIDTRAARLSTT
jgi:DNA-binding XRE family transcriptional regulator